MDVLALTFLGRPPDCERLMKLILRSPCNIMFLDECLAHDLLHNFRELQKIVQSGEDKSSCESSSSEALRQKANDLYKRKKLKDAREMYSKVL